MEEILTASQVAELLQMHPRTVYKLVKQGSIPGRKCGGGWRFRRSEIMTMISPNNEGGPSFNESGEEKPNGGGAILPNASLFPGRS
jgi:excisionase family DNA binding protein